MGIYILEEIHLFHSFTLFFLFGSYFHVLYTKGNLLYISQLDIEFLVALVWNFCYYKLSPNQHVSLIFVKSKFRNRLFSFIWIYSNLMFCFTFTNYFSILIISFCLVITCEDNPYFHYLYISLFVLLFDCLFQLLIKPSFISTLNLIFIRFLISWPRSRWIVQVDINKWHEVVLLIVHCISNTSYIF